tara:strand:- start:940 stop:1227 length:288 start_codon:yes stop_codon:yes gene_type:complete
MNKMSPSLVTYPKALEYENKDCYLNQLLTKYVTIDKYEGREYYILEIPEYNHMEVYRTDKYFDIEILQDMDMIFEKNGKKTNYANEYYNKYMNKK